MKSLEPLRKPLDHTRLGILGWNVSSPPPRLSKISPRIKYFLVVFAVTFTLAFVVEHFLRAGNMSRIHPGVLLENEPSGKSAAIALVFGLIVVFLTTKKKFD